MEIDGCLVLSRAAENAAYGQLQINGESLAFECDAIPDLPAMFLRFPTADDGRRSLLDEGLLLLRRNLDFGVNVKQRLWVAGKLREIRVGSVNINPTEPNDRRDGNHAGDFLDLGAGALGQEDGQRHSVARDQPQWIGLLQVPINLVDKRHQRTQDKECQRDAEHRENRAPFVPRPVLPDEALIAHTVKAKASLVISR